MSLWSDIFGEPSEDRSSRDVDEGSAAPRNSAEEQAVSDNFEENIETGNDPLDNSPNEPNDPK